MPISKVQIDKNSVEIKGRHRQMYHEAVPAQKHTFPVRFALDVKITKTKTCQN